MDLITHFLSIGLIIWFVLLAGLIAGRVLRGDIQTTGFLSTMRPGQGGTPSQTQIAPERVLAVALFPMVIVSYIFNALHADMSVPHPSLPDISDQMVMLLTGGNGLYLAGKIARV